MSEVTKVELGRIVGAHGLRGQVRVRLFGDAPENLMQCEDVWLADDRDDDRAQLYPMHYEGSGRPGEARIQLQGVRDRDEALALRGKLVLARAAILEALAPGEFYWHELIGCQVETEAGDVVGTVREIWETGAHDVLVVRDATDRQNLIPTSRELTREIDIPNKRIVVKALPGLIELGKGDVSDD